MTRQNNLEAPTWAETCENLTELQSTLLRTQKFGSHWSKNRLYHEQLSRLLYGELTHY